LRDEVRMMMILLVLYCSSVVTPYLVPYRTGSIP
jgi:hypothetical protein